MWYGGKRVSPDVSSLALEYAVEEKDSTSIEDATRINEAGLFQATVQYNGYVDYSSTELVNFSNLGVPDSLLAFAIDENLGSRAYFLKILQSSYQKNGAVGDLFGFSFGAAGREQPFQGRVLHSSVVSSSSNGGVFELGALNAGEVLTAQLHVISSVGTGDQTLDVIIASDDNASFTSGTTRINFTQATTSGFAERGTVTQAVLGSDDHFRVEHVVAGTGAPEFEYAVLISVR